LTPRLAFKQSFTSQAPKIPAQSVVCPGPEHPVRGIHARASREALNRIAAGGIQPRGNGGATTKLLSITTRPNLAVPDRFQAGGAARITKHVYVAPVDPLFLFYCSLLWHKQADSSAGWELVHCLRSWDRVARTMAAALLAKTENARLLIRDVRRAVNDFGSPDRRSDSKSEDGSSGEAATMKTPYGLEVIESCLTCKLRKDSWFCGLSPEVLKAFSAATHPTTYPGGALLFVEGQMPRGAFVLCSGKAKLSTTSREGKVLILKVAEAGEVLGLSAAISGTAYELTAETTGPCQVNFVERKALLSLMEKSGELGLHSARVLSNEFQSAYRDIHDLVLARSSAGKLARLLLSWTPARGPLGHALGETTNEIRIRSSLTHEEMAQMIGASRETVTRLLSDLKKKELIRLEGPILVIRDRTALEALAS
jgi:CRP/FNR family cyclic AMP-dependent transcriptional regulator